MSTLKLYNDAIKPLPPEERLRIAAMILNDATAPPPPPAPAADPWAPEEGVDISDEWTEEDMVDATHASLLRFEAEEGEYDA